MKILFLYFGQPRLVKQCLPWHDEIVNSMKLVFDVDIDFHYSLWNEYHEYTTKIQTVDKREWDPEHFLNADTQSLIECLTTNRPEGSKVTYKFHDYTPVEEIWQTIQPYLGDTYLNRGLFYHLFAQLASKGIAANELQEDYDAIILTRTDLVFDKSKYHTLYKACEDFITRVNKSKKGISNLGYVPWLRHSNHVGSFYDDILMLTNTKSLKVQYDNWEEKLIYFVKKHCEFSSPSYFQRISQHFTGCNFYVPYNIDHKNQDAHWVYEYPDLFETYILVRLYGNAEQYLKKISSASFFSLKKIYQTPATKYGWKNDNK